MKVIKRIIHKMYRAYYRLFLFFYYLKDNKCIEGKQNNEIVSLELLRSFFETNNDISYSVCKETIPTPTAKHKWVGAQLLDENIICIPNDETTVIVKKKQWETLGITREGLFKWTGGCVWNNAVYCFPRTANSFLKIDHNGIHEMSLDVTYSFEHHYAGVVTKDGVVYQPPRNTSHILKTDLKTGKSKKIEIINEVFQIKLSYCGSIVHPNGFIYFFPVYNNKVIKLDPKTDKWCYIGERITTYCFDAKVGHDGNIYGFNHSNGIMKINVRRETVENIHMEIPSFAYGTKLGINGRLYSIPGGAQYAYEYNLTSDEVKILYDTNSLKDAKYAGGLTNRQGIIYGVPAENNEVIAYKPSRLVSVPDELYKQFFVDNY